MTRPVKFTNYSMWVSKKYEDDWYEWCVFVDEPYDVLRLITVVEYTLHPTFPDPVRTTTDREHRFPILSSGWGEFSIKTKVDFTDGTSTRGATHVRLERSGWPLGPAPEHLPDPELERVYRALFHQKYRWRKLPTIAKESGVSADRAIHLLETLESERLVRKAFFRMIDGSESWAATAVVGVLPTT